MLVGFLIQVSFYSQAVRGLAFSAASIIEHLCAWLGSNTINAR